MNPGPYNEKLRQFAAVHLQKLNIRVQEHGRVELTPTMAFVEAMVAVPLDVNGGPFCPDPPYMVNVQYVPTPKKSVPVKKRRKK